MQAQSTGEDSNSSDHSAASDTGDYDDTMNGSMDQRFSSFLGLQGIPGLLPGPSGMHNDSFGKFLPKTFDSFLVWKKKKYKIVKSWWQNWQKIVCF